jgi:2-iminoacetate synthase
MRSLDMKQADSFSTVLSSIDQAELALSINHASLQQVDAVLAKVQHRQPLHINDMAVLLSPSAEKRISLMAQLSHQLTKQRFGHTIQLFIPLYLSNQCSNICSYCGFSMHNKIKRTTLTLTQIEAEFVAIKKMGFDHILLVTGEAQRTVGLAYFLDVLPLAKRYFSHVAMEVQPLDEQDYKILKTAGLDAVMVYQETYQAISYAKHHLKGKKADFNYRLETPERLGRAGVDKIGLGCLLGLANWRIDCLLMAYHLRFLQQRYWRSRYSLSFPRLRPCEGGFKAESFLTDLQLIQIITAFRLFDQTIELSLSTRERQQLRDQLIPLGITSMSAASSTQPGGYSDATSKALEQFSIDDERSPEQVASSIHQKGYQAVWKDWQTEFN